MKQFSKAILIVVMSMIATGCGMYNPQLADIALIEHRGDTRASVGINGLGVGSTVTTGITDHLALQVNGYVNADNLLYGHTAIGYYTGHNKLAIEGYLGFGYGYGEHTSVDHDESSRGIYHLSFAQVNIGWRNLTRAHIDCGFAFKYGWLVPDFRYSKVRFNGDGTYTSIDGRYDKGNNLFEPQLFFRIGGEHVKYNLQMGFCFLDDMDYGNSAWTFYWPLSLSMGVTFSL